MRHPIGLPRLILLALLPFALALGWAPSARATNYAIHTEGPSATTFVRIPDSPSLHFDANAVGTIAFWMRNHSGEPGRHIAGGRQNCDTDPHFWQFFIEDAHHAINAAWGGVYGTTTGTMDVPLDQWLHVALTGDGANCYLYVNCQLVGTAPRIPGSTFVNGGEIRWGRSATCSGFVGEIDDAVLLRSFSPPEKIAEIMTGCLDPSANDVMGYWSFDEAVNDQQVHDLSPNGNDGTLGSGGTPDQFDAVRVVADRDGLFPGGTVYRHEVGQPCTSNAQRLPDVTVVIGSQQVAQGSGVMRTTDANGNYQLGCIDFEHGGPWNIGVIPPENWTVVCPATGSYAIDEGLWYLSGSQQLDFGLEPPGLVQDLEVQIGSTPVPRAGRGITYYVAYRNTGGIPVAPTIRVHLPSGLTFLSADHGGTYSDGNVTWSAATIPPGGEGTVSLEVKVKVPMAIGTTFYTVASIEPGEGDIDPSDNNATDVSTVVGSYDPNDMAVLPDGRIQADQRLKYRIRFQNVGNAEAFDIVVRDTLDEKLDLTSLRLTAGSHAYESLLDGREIVWTFTGINLPDSTADEPGSHGFVEFEIDPVAGLAPGAEIRNRAGIYFDLNEVVGTNEVVNTILAPAAVDGPVGVRRALAISSVQPNPTRGSTTLRFAVPVAGELSLDLFGADGRRVQHMERGRVQAGQHGIVLNRDGRQAAGIYLVRGRLRDATGQVTEAWSRIVILGR